MRGMKAVCSLYQASLISSQKYTEAQPVLSLFFPEIYKKTMEVRVGYIWACRNAGINNQQSLYSIVYVIAAFIKTYT